MIIMKTILVIGLGRFGRHLSLKLMELGNEVMVIDKDEEAVEKLAPFVTDSRIGDCQDEGGTPGARRQQLRHVRCLYQ